MSLISKCEPFCRLFDEAGTPLSSVESDADLVWACERVLQLPRLGITKHVLTMVMKAADIRTPLTDRLALRAVLAGDDQRAARIWRREFDGPGMQCAPSGATGLRLVRAA